MSANPLDVLSPFERNVVLLARRTDRNWERIAFELDRDPKIIQEVFTLAKAKLEGKQPPEASVAAAPDKTTATRGGTTVPVPESSRSTSAVLTDALGELEARREQLLPLIAELKEIDKAIATLRKATGGPSPTPSGRGGVRDIPEALAEAIVAACDGNGPVERAAVAAAVGRAEGPHFYGVLSKLEQAGRIAKVDGGYAVPAPVAAA
jgi:hypothetical protein